MSYPEGCYVYVYLDGDTPFYVGAGHGNRAWVHLQPCVQRRYQYPLYFHLQKMLEAGDRPIILIVKEGLTAEEGRAGEADLIELLGTRRAGTGTLFNIDNPLRGDHGPAPVLNGWKPTIWGRVFDSLSDVIRDPRCVVSGRALRSRLGRGMALEEAAETPAGELHKLTCWGEAYRNWKAFSLDPRCVVSDSTLRRRVTKLGWSAERAATTPPAACGSWRRGPTTGAANGSWRRSPATPNDDNLD